MYRRLAAAALLTLVCAPAGRATPPPKKKRVEGEMVTIAKIEPTTVHPGDPITVTGKRLDQIAAVLLGKISPKITEQTPTKLVFLAPNEDKNRYFQSYVFFLISGRPLYTTHTEIKIVPETQATGVKVTPGASVDEKGTLTAGKPKSWTIPLEGATGLEIAIATTGGEVEAKVERAGAPSEPLVHATYAGALTWRLRSRDLGDTPSVTLTISTDASRVGYQTTVQRRSTDTKREAGRPRMRAGAHAEEPPKESKDKE